MEYFQAIGTRKEATASVKVTQGKGEIKVNKRLLKDYFHRDDLLQFVMSPIQETKLENQLDITAQIKGGGIRGQADALKLAIARAIVKFNAECKKPLKTNGFLTCDARNKERRKYGLAKARKAYQWTKR